MSYTNQKTFRSLQVTLDLLTSTVTKFTSVIRHSTSAIPTITQYQCKRLSVTPAKHTPKQYHSNTQYIAQIEARKIAQYKDRTQVLDSGISHHCHQNVRPPLLLGLMSRLDAE